MRIFLAGATGVLGIRLVPQLIAAGHTVAGMTRSPEKADLLRSLGAEPVVGDVFAAEALRHVVVTFAPGLVMHQLTDLPDDSADIAAFSARNNRIRREGTANLLAAARAAGTTSFLAQSVAWQLTGDGGAAVAEHEHAVLAAGGVVLRYGQLYGPGTFHPDAVPAPPRIHIAEAASRTVELLDAPPGIVTITSEG